MLGLMEKWKDEYLTKKGMRYKNHVNKFIDYLKGIEKNNMPNNITLNDVSNCVGYYVKRGSIRSVSSMELHLESLKNFYDYLLQTGKSRDIFSQMNYEDYKNNLSSKYQLVEKVERETFSIETIKDILSKLDKYLEVDYFSLIGTQNQKRYLQRSALRLFIKLTLVAPAKRQVISHLKYKDLDDDFHMVVVNDVELSIPNSLARDIKNALKLKDLICKGNIRDNEEIFKYIIGSNFSEEDLNRWFCSFINEQQIIGIDDISPEKDTYPVEPLMKTAISNMIKVMANLAYISKVSGIKISTLENTYHDEIFGLNNKQSSIGESIDWEIRKSGYYSYI